MAHGVAAALGISLRVPHGLACAVMLPTALRVNCDTSQAALAELARLTLGGSWPNDATAAAAFIERIEQLADEVGVPKRLRDVDVQREQIAELVARSRGNSMNGNPRQLSDEELTNVLEELL